MRAYVLLQMRELCELPLADLTAVGLDAEVDPGVLWQVGAVRERLAALRALVRFGFAHVRLRVQLQFRFAAEHLQQNKWLLDSDWMWRIVTQIYVIGSSN